MRSRILLTLVLVTLPLAAASAQEKPDATKTEPVKAIVIGAGEVAVEGGAEIPVESSQVLRVFEGRRPSTFYITVKVSREIPANTAVNAGDVQIRLTMGSANPVDPYAAALYKSQLAEGKAAEYSVSDKKRWVAETYCFAAAAGQRDWAITVDGQAAGKVLDHYVTLLVNNVDKVTSRLTLPDGTKQIIGEYRQMKFQFPAGSYELILEVRGHDKVKLPWTKYDRGDYRYLGVVGDLRDAPMIPADRLKPALAKIDFAYKKYKDQKGVGGGTYNLGTLDDPAHVAVYFGRDGNPGPPYKLAADGIEVELAPETKSTRPKRGKDFEVTRYTDQKNAAWLVQPWGKMETVDISREAKEIEGETVCNRLIIRSTERKPSVWDATSGLLSKGALYDKDEGYFEVRAKKEGDLFLLWGEQTKEP